ncbi:MAG: TetR/AcrR family transcriptional regulator [Actinomycetota bacterium]
MTPAATRKTAEERREEVLDAALTEFAARGFAGASTDAIARRVGISQPYLFRLFGTKKELFIASVERCFADTLEKFRLASEGLSGHDALMAMADAYGQWILSDSRRLRGQMQAYVACDDADVRAVVRRGFGRIVDLAESTGVTAEEVHHFFARGMLLNVIASMDLLGAEEPWAARLIESCGRRH